MRVRKHYSAFPPRSFLALQLSGLFFFVLLGDLPQELFHKLFRLSGGKAWIRGHHLSDNEHSPIEVDCLSIRNSNHGMNFKPLIIALPVAFLIGCASEPTPDMLPGGQPNFDTYAIQAKAYVAERRHYVTDDHVAEIEGNSPFEIRPKNPNGQAVLMIHGLGDSLDVYRPRKNISRSGLSGSNHAPSRTRIAPGRYDRSDFRGLDQGRK